MLRESVQGLGETLALGQIVTFCHTPSLAIAGDGVLLCIGGAK
jgi:hypothetical protein